MCLVLYAHCTANRVLFTSLTTSRALAMHYCILFLYCCVIYWQLKFNISAGESMAPRVH